MSEFEVAKPLAFPVRFPDVPCYLVLLNRAREEVHSVLGTPMLTDWEDGLGNADYWAFEYPCGLQIVVRFLHAGSGNVVADSPEIRHVIRHLPFQEQDCLSIDKESFKNETNRLIEAWPERRTEIESLHDFQVWRQDDTGNAFKVGETTSERDAKCWVRQFETLHHKQTYWYSRADATANLARKRSSDRK